MSNFLHCFSDMAFIWLFKTSVVGHFDEIPLVSLHTRSADYIRIISTSLELIRDHDPRRFRRVTQQTRWLVDSPLRSGSYSGQYHHRIKATRVDFEFDESVGDDFFHAAHFAGVVVHEATHGEIRDRGIATSPENRIQVERICRAEQNRFIGLLRQSFPDLSEELIRPFDPGDWAGSWEPGPVRKAVNELRRGKQKSRREQVNSSGP